MHGLSALHTSWLTRAVAYFIEILVLFSPLLSSEGPKQLTRQLIRVSDVKSNGRLRTYIQVGTRGRRREQHNENEGQRLRQACMHTQRGL